MYRKVHVKYILLSLILSATVSNIILSLATNFFLLVLSRLFCGFSSNSLIAARKLLQTLEFKEQSSQFGVYRKALLFNRSGIAAGSILASTLFSSLRFSSSEYVQSHHLMVLGFTLTLLSLAGCFIVLLIETPLLYVTEHKTRYAELPEIKSINENQDSERQSKDQVDSNNLFSTAVLANYQVFNDEGVGPEDVKFYSPRGIVNKSSVPKQIQSARPHLGHSFEFPEEVHEENHEDDKKIHISFIDEEFENEETNEKIDEAVNKTQIIKGITENLLKKKAFRFRLLISLAIGALINCVPVSVLLKFNDRGKDLVLVVTSISILVPLLVYHLFSPYLMEKLSIFHQISWSTSLSLLLLVFCPIIDSLSNDSVLLVPTWLMLISMSEILSPLSLILLSDSVPLNEREHEIFNSGIYGLIFKAIGGLISSTLTSLGGYLSLGVLPCTIPFILMKIQQKDLKSFTYIHEAPYKT